VSCVRVTWDGQEGADGTKWNGIGWEYPEGRLGLPRGATEGYDLTGSEWIRFWARADEPGIDLMFKFGHLDDSCGERPSYDIWLPLSDEREWSSIVLPILQDLDMSNVTIGLATIFNDEHEQGEPGFTFYLDDIEYSRNLQKDMSSVIGGFCWVTNEVLSPTGCTIYLDDIMFE